MNKILNTCMLNDVINETNVIDMTLQPMRPMDIELPRDKTGYVYVIASIRNTEMTYIGTTLNLKKRLNTHNSGYGSKSTQSIHLRPWTLLGFICGFKGSKSEINHYRYKVEKIWKQKITEYKETTNTIITSEDIVLIGKKLITDDLFCFLNLKFVQTVQFGIL